MGESFDPYEDYECGYMYYLTDTWAQRFRFWLSRRMWDISHWIARIAALLPAVGFWKDDEVAP